MRYILIIALSLFACGGRVQFEPRTHTEDTPISQSCGMIITGDGTGAALRVAAPNNTISLGAQAFWGNPDGTIGTCWHPRNALGAGPYSTRQTICSDLDPTLCLRKGPSIGLIDGSQAYAIAVTNLDDPSTTIWDIGGDGGWKETFGPNGGDTTYRIQSQPNCVNCLAAMVAIPTPPTPTFDGGIWWSGTSFMVQSRRFRTNGQPITWGTQSNGDVRTGSPSAQQTGNLWQPLSNQEFASIYLGNGAGFPTYAMFSTLFGSVGNSGNNFLAFVPNGSLSPKLSHATGLSSASLDLPFTLGVTDGSGNSLFGTAFASGDSRNAFGTVPSAVFARSFQDTGPNAPGIVWDVRYRGR